MAETVMGVVFFGIVFGPLAFSAGSSLYWLVKGRWIMALVLALFAVYIATEMFATPDDKPWLTTAYFARASLESWLGLVIAVAVGGAGEFILDMFGSDRRP